MRFLTVLLASFLISTSATFAAQLTKPDVEALFAKGKLRFQAGSVGTFRADLTFVFRHGSSSEKGTYTISDAGVVSIYDKRSRRQIDFYFDKPKQGKIALIYLSGPGKGKRYPLR